MGVKQSRPKHAYGHKRPQVHRKLAASLANHNVPKHVVKATPSVDLRPFCPPVYDQGALGSCTACALAFLYEFDQMKQGIKNPVVPSILFIYFNERVIEGTTCCDEGAELYDGVKVLSNVGTCNETVWPYIIEKFNVKPTEQAYTIASKFKAKTFAQLQQNLESLKKCLISGFPFCCGISIYQSFESAKTMKTGIVPMPKKNEQYLGGHAVAIVGFDDNYQCFILRNSWSDKVGMKGYFAIPYDYITNPEYASDFWVVSTVSA